MKLEEFEKYFDILELAQKAIGFDKKNKKQLQRLETLKQLILEIYVDGVTKLDFSYQGSYKDYFENLESWISSNESVKRVWLRFDDLKCRVPGRPWILSKDLWEDETLTAGIVVRLQLPTITSINDSSLEVGDSLNSAVVIVA